CDISFNALSETSTIPKIKLNWIDQNNLILQSSELIYPYEKSNYQFHYSVKAPNSESSFVKLKIYFLSYKNQIYSIKNLKYTIYSK
ncbi:MAG: hypothetical protein ABIO44_13180, partial [Saprospiraceae bacterium]